jgi:hypothetical protein
VTTFCTNDLRVATVAGCPTELVGTLVAKTFEHMTPVHGGELADYVSTVAKVPLRSVLVGINGAVRAGDTAYEFLMIGHCPTRMRTAIIVIVIKNAERPSIAGTSTSRTTRRRSSEKADRRMG